MRQKYIMPLDDPGAGLMEVGGKGASLSRLANASLPVPGGFHIMTDAYRAFVSENNLQTLVDRAIEGIDLDKPSSVEQASAEIFAAFQNAEIPREAASEIASAYGEFQGSNPAVAVRSSATAEDLPEAAFAGQQDTYLNITGAGNVLEAVRNCWASLWTARAIRYRAQQDVDTEGAALAVVVQLLVPAEAAGVMFTVNPLDGNRDQVHISAAWGLGDAVVGGRVTPDDYLVEKATGAVLSAAVAEKEIMTVRVNGGAKDHPVPENLRGVQVLADEDLARLARLGTRIESLFGMPVDIEWALADGMFHILQARPVTALPEVVVPPPDEWPLPDEKARYMRASIVDMMPEPLSPLFGTLGLEVYNDAILQMMADVTESSRKGFPDELVTTIQTYAYLRTNFSMGEWWAMLTRLGSRMKKLIQDGPRHFREEALPAYRDAVEKLSRQPVSQISSSELWRDTQDLVYEAMYFLSVLQVDTLGASAGSEGLFTMLYTRFYKEEDSPDAPEFLMGQNTIASQAEKAIWDMANWAQDEQELRMYVLENESARLAADLAEDRSPAGIPTAVWDEWRRQVEAYRTGFGYILFDLDFARPIPAEDPAPALEVVRTILRGEGSDPYERQQRLEKQRLEATAALQERLRGMRGWAVRKALGWATSMAEVREDSISLIGLGYPRLRSMLHELGARFSKAGLIEEPADVYWLERADIEALVADLKVSVQFVSMADVVRTRKEICRAVRKHLPPVQLPYSKKYMGIPIDVFVPGEGGQEGGRLKGVGASGGQVSGAARVITGPEDFDTMQKGEVLVAKMTTPAWTPLFALASAVVTDIGGPLSHGSIVAREYGIPAVMGTGTATRVIETGQQITVDGDAGYVTLSEGN